MIKVYLHGSLKQFGESFELDVVSAAEAMLALTSQIKGMRDVLASCQWQIVKDGGEAITDDSITIGLKDGSSLHVVPAIDGAGGIVDIFAGITMIVLGGVSGNWSMVQSGFNKTTGGISGLLTSAPSTVGASERSNPDERPSFLYDGATNTSKQGLPVPIIYGRIRAGSIVISAGLTSEQI